MPRGHYAKRARWKEPRYILPDEHEAILAEIARDKNPEGGLELARGAVGSSSSAGPAAPSRSGKPKQ